MRIAWRWFLISNKSYHKRMIRMTQLNQLAQQHILLHALSPTLTAQLQHGSIHLLIFLLAIDIVFHNGLIRKLLAHVCNPFPIAHVSQISYHAMFLTR